MSKIRVLLADDHSLVRKGFRRMLEDETDLEVIGEAVNGLDAVQKARDLQPDVLVMDMSMPELDGVQATREVARHVPNTRILILSMFSDDAYVSNSLGAGASGYMLKDAVDNDLPRAIRAIADGNSYLSPGLKYEKNAAADKDEPQLTPRETQVLQMIAQGKSNKEIAALLGLSVNTVSVHRANLMDKMNIHKAAELVLYAIRKGLITPP
jgi:two-component system, NarL family, response regulator NreC